MELEPLTVLGCFLGSPTFQGSEGDFSRRKAGHPGHDRQGSQEEECGKARESVEAPVLLWSCPHSPGLRTWRQAPWCDPQPLSHLPILPPGRRAPLCDAARPEHSPAGPHHHSSGPRTTLTHLSVSGDIGEGAWNIHARGSHPPRCAHCRTPSRQVLSPPFYRMRKPRRRGIHMPEAPQVCRWSQIRAWTCLPKAGILSMSPAPNP